MKSEPRGLSGALVRAWSAVARAFTPTAGASRFRAEGSDTTLFGALPESAASEQQSRRRGEAWDPLGESTDFGDPQELGEQSRR